MWFSSNSFFNICRLVFFAIRVFFYVICAAIFVSLIGFSSVMAQPLKMSRQVEGVSEFAQLNCSKVAGEGEFVDLNIIFFDLDEQYSEETLYNCSAKWIINEKEIDFCEILRSLCFEPIIVYVTYDFEKNINNVYSIVPIWEYFDLMAYGVENYLLRGYHLPMPKLVDLCLGTYIFNCVAGYD